MEDSKLQCGGCGMTYQITYNYIENGMQETEIKIVSEELEGE